MFKGQHSSLNPPRNTLIHFKAEVIAQPDGLGLEKGDKDMNSTEITFSFGTGFLHKLEYIFSGSSSSQTKERSLRYAVRVSVLKSAVLGSYKYLIETPGNYEEH